MKKLEKKTVFITGGLSGIGKACAIAAAKEGANIVVADMKSDNSEKALQEIVNENPKAIFVECDVSKFEQVQVAIQKTISVFKTLDVALNNAGIGGPLATTSDYPIDGWQNVININLSGVFYGIKYQIPALLKSGGGSIVNIASILGAVGTRMSPAYVAAKHGVVGLTKAAALEYADQKIRVNAVGPGYIKTPLVTNALDEATLKMLVGLHPIGRLGESEEIAELILWLGSDKSSFVTGTYYAADGGYLAQ